MRVHSANDGESHSVLLDLKRSEAALLHEVLGQCLERPGLTALDQALLERLIGELAALLAPKGARGG